MADNQETTTQTKEEEEREWRQRILDELHRLNRSMEKIAERLGGVNMS
jgi:hypothetical protein